MTSAERELAARWRREEEIQLVQHHAREAVVGLARYLRDLDARYEKLVNDYDELREKLDS